MDNDAGGVYDGLGAGASLAGCLLGYAHGYVVDTGGIFAAADGVSRIGNLLADEAHQPVALVENRQALKLAGGHDAFDAG